MCVGGGGGEREERRVTSISQAFIGPSHKATKPHSCTYEYNTISTAMQVLALTIFQGGALNRFTLHAACSCADHH